MTKIFHVLLFIKVICFCSSGAASSEEGFPVSFLLFQALNFIIFLLILGYLIVTKIPKKLVRQYEDYLSMNERAENLYYKAQRDLQEVRQKLLKMEERENQFDKELNDELENIEKQMSQDLKSQCSSILRSAENFSNQELMKLKEKLKQDLLNQVEFLCLENCQNQPQNDLLFLKKLSIKEQ